MDIPASYVSYERGFFHVLFGTLMALMLLILGWLGWLVDKGAIWSWWLSIIPA